MNRYAINVIIGLTIGLAAFVLFSMLGCASSGLYAMSDEWCAAHPDASHARCSRPPATTYCQYGAHPGDCDKRQSWDQENLKRNDSGCPTGIYDAPGGILRLCPVS